MWAGGGVRGGGGRGEEGLQTRQLQISLCAESELDVHRWCVTALMGSTPAPGGKMPQLPLSYRVPRLPTHFGACVSHSFQKKKSCLLHSA